MSDLPSLLASAAAFGGADPYRWQAELADSDLHVIDWPSEFDGLELSRREQLDVITCLAENNCELMPESITLYAPAIMMLELPLQQKQDLLSAIKQDPFAGVAFEVDTDTLSLTHSPLWALCQLMTTYNLLADLSENSSELAELAIDIESMQVMFLNNDSASDIQIRAKANQLNFTGYLQLFSALSYYAFLDIDDAISGNEPLPFNRERRYLSQLRQSLSFNDMLLHDEMLEEVLP